MRGPAAFRLLPVLLLFMLHASPVAAALLVRKTKTNSFPSLAFSPPPPAPHVCTPESRSSPRSRISPSFLPILPLPLPGRRSIAIRRERRGERRGDSRRTLRRVVAVKGTFPPLFSASTSSSLFSSPWRFFLTELPLLWDRCSSFSSLPTTRSLSAAPLPEAVQGSEAEEEDRTLTLEELAPTDEEGSVQQEKASTATEDRSEREEEPDTKGEEGTLTEQDDSVTPTREGLNLFGAAAMDPGREADEVEEKKTEEATARALANFDPEKIGEDLTLTFLRVPERQVNDALKRVKKFLFHRRNFKSVRDEDTSTASAFDNALLADAVALSETAAQAEQTSPREEGEKEHATGERVQRGGDATAADTEEAGKEAKTQSAKWKRILLSEEVQEDLQQLPSSVREWLLTQKFPVGRETVHLSYAHLTAEEAMKKLVPAGLDMPRRYETIGHIAHLNLREHLLPYRFLIARLLLDKQLGLATVVNKIGIASQWRELQFEHLGGEPRFVARLKENDMHFEIDYERVYWNSRLAAERERITAEVPRSSIILDCFAGVGAFSLFLAQRRSCLVLANDFNPNAVLCMKKNRSLNKVSSESLRLFNLDARAFVRRVAGSPEKLARLVRLRRDLEKNCMQASAGAQTRNEEKQKRGENHTNGEGVSSAKKRRTTPEAEANLRETEAVEATGDVEGKCMQAEKRKETLVNEKTQIECHYLMNLPELAIDFLDVFSSLLTGSGTSSEGNREKGGESEAGEGEQGEPFTCSDASPPTEEEIRQIERLRHRIHCYGFSRSSPPEIELRPRVEKSLGFWPEDVVVREVRDVAPNKRMFCLSFDIPFSFLSSSPPS